MIKYLNPQLIKRKSQYHLDAISFVLFLQNLKNDNTNSIETSKYNQLWSIQFIKKGTSGILVV